MFSSHKSDEETKPLEDLLFKEEKGDLILPVPRLQMNDQALNRVAALTYNDKICDKIMVLLEKTITPENYSWLVLYKSILALHTIVRFGSDRALQRCVALYRFIYPLQEYNSAMIKKGLIFSSSGGRDFGLPVRTEAKALANVLKTDEAMQAYRSRVNDGLDTLVPLGQQGGGDNYNYSSNNNYIDDSISNSGGAPDLSYRSPWPSVNPNPSSSSGHGRDVFGDLDFLSAPSTSTSITSSSRTSQSSPSDILDLLDSSSPANVPQSYSQGSNNSYSNGTSGTSSSSSSQKYWDPVAKQYTSTLPGSISSSSSNSNSSAVSSDLLDIFSSSSTTTSFGGISTYNNSNSFTSNSSNSMNNSNSSSSANLYPVRVNPYAQDASSMYPVRVNPFAQQQPDNSSAYNNSNNFAISNSTNTYFNNSNSNSNSSSNSNSNSRVDPFASIDDSSSPTQPSYNSYNYAPPAPPPPPPSFNHAPPSLPLTNPYNNPNPNPNPYISNSNPNPSLLNPYSSGPNFGYSSQNQISQQNNTSPPSSGDDELPTYAPPRPPPLPSYPPPF